MDNSSFEVLIDKNERRLLEISRMVATPVNSSIIEIALYRVIFSPVSTTRQNPSKFDEVFRMCSDLLCDIWARIMDG